MSAAILTMFGDQGSSWRMIKLKRAFEAAKEENKTLHEIAIERYGSIKDFNNAVSEQIYLDEKAGIKSKLKLLQEEKVVKNENIEDALKAAQEKLKSEALSLHELNKLKSQALKAKIMKAPNLKEMEERYNYELERYESANAEIRILDAPSGSAAKRPKSDDKSLDDLVREEKLSGHEHKKSKTYTLNHRGSAADYNRQQEALADCPFCYHDGTAPEVPVLALGTLVYLTLPQVIQMVPYHCLIVPIQHTLSTLDLEDDAWSEIRNFKKCLLKMMDSIGQSVIFMEQVVDLKWHRHVAIECIPVSREFQLDAPAYYKEALLSAEEEWSQHKKIIVTDKGFRNCMVSKLEYFHVWFDLNHGMGHIIESPKEWEPWFGKEVIASAMDLPPHLWRKPRRAAQSELQTQAFRQLWKPFDWTAMLGSYE